MSKLEMHNLRNLCNMLSRVPQGNVLGSLLFIVIFIKDFPSHIKSATSIIFADDSKCSHAIKSPEDGENLQSDIHNASIYGAIYLVFHSMRPNLYIFVSGLKQQTIQLM